MASMIPSSLRSTGMRESCTITVPRGGLASFVGARSAPPQPAAPARTAIAATAAGRLRMSMAPDGSTERRARGDAQLLEKDRERTESGERGLEQIEPHEPRQYEP